MNEQSQNRLSPRALVTLMMAFSLVGLPIFGTALHFLSQDPLYSTGSLYALRHGIMAAHNILGVIFVLSAVYHLVFNRRALLRYAQAKMAEYTVFSKELATAAAVVTILVLLTFGHAFIL